VIVDLGHRGLRQAQWHRNPYLASVGARDSPADGRGGAGDQQINGTCAPWLPGYQVKVLDDNCIEASEHRLEVLRVVAGGALPGRSLALYELEMVTDVIPGEDGHTQERAARHPGRARSLADGSQLLRARLSARDRCARDRAISGEKLDSTGSKLAKNEQILPL